MNGLTVLVLVLLGLGNGRKFVGSGGQRSCGNGA